MIVPQGRLDRGGLSLKQNRGLQSDVLRLGFEDLETRSGRQLLLPAVELIVGGKRGHRALQLGQ